MSPRPTVLFRLLSLLGVLMAAALVGAPAGQAATTPWGVLGHFGETESELRFPEAAFGVNPADGNVWAVDVELNSSKEEVLRIQEFTPAGALVASRTIEPNEAEIEKTEAFRQAVGIAFDASKERAYVLIDEESSKTPKEEPAASELLAFSTKPTGSKIESAAGVTGGVLVPRATGKLTGTPVGKKELSPTATEKGGALLEPGGIAVNPVNHQVLITGWVGTEKPEVWAISEAGEISTVWEDKTGAFEDCGCLSSPVVTKTGQILVIGNELQEVTELPSDLNSNTAPKRAFWLPRSAECSAKEFNNEAPCPFIEKLTRIEPTVESGGSMSIGPEGSMYLHVTVKNAAEGGFQDGAVMVVNEKFEETGWIGAGSWGGTNKGCAVNESDPGNLGGALVAGYQGKAFMLERGDPKEKEHAKVLELGSGGDPSGCPKASTTKPKAEVGGVPLTSVPIASTVTFSSELTQANALSTEWEFEAGVAAQVVSKRQQEKTLVEHQFTKAGPATITEKITTDDLASPLITVSETINLIAPGIKEEKVTAEGTSATLKGEVNPMHSLTKCEFQYAPASEPFTGSNVKKVACPTNPGEEEKWVTEQVRIEGLTAGTEYHFRLEPKAGKWEGTEEPGVKWVAPIVGAPGATTLAATEVGVAGATLNGEVKPEGSSATCTFEYGPTTSYGKTVGCGTLTSGTTFVHVSAAITSLTGGTPYHYRVVAKNSSGTTPGTDLTLTTSPAPTPPSAETLSATAITQTGATLKGLVDPNGEATSCRFEYGTSTAYGSTAPCPVAPGSGRSAVEEALAVSGLASGTTYHYRLLAESPIGKSTGADKTFTTGATSGGGGSTTPPGGNTTPKQTVLPETTVSPTVKVAGTALAVAANGVFSLKLSCIAGATSCAGTVTVKTLSAVAARAAHAAKAKKEILTLATGTFSIAGGKLKTLSLHLSSKAKKLLAKLHTVRARVTIVSHDSQGHSQTTTALVTLKSAKKKK